MPSSSFDIAACVAALGQDASAFALDAVAECDSTNTQLMRCAEVGAPSGAVLVADAQTAGRGRRGRNWISTPQDSLTFSLLWRFAPHSAAPEALSLAVGLGLQRGLDALGAAAKLKWPNDVLCDDRKLAGVLVEVQSGDIKSAIIGIGVNLRLPKTMPADIATAATALADRIPNLPSRENVLAILLSHLASILRRYEAEGFAGLHDSWQAQHAYQHREVRVSGGEELLEGICCGITDRGELIIRTSGGARNIISGDVTLRPA